MENEVFIELKNHPGYFVSNLGRFRRGKTKMLATPTNNKGYCVFGVSQDGRRKYYSAHRLVAEYFIGSVDGMEVNHKNFDKKDNRAENLEIVTHSENMKHYHTDERAKETYKKIAVAKTKEEHERSKRKKVPYIPKPAKNPMQLPRFLSAQSLADKMGLTRQRVHWMLRHPGEGDNRARIKAALQMMRAEFDNCLNNFEK